MIRVAAGDRDARERLAVRLVPHARAVARALLGASADADDAVQIGLVRVLEGARTYRGSGTVERWASTIVARVCLRLGRQRRRGLQLVDPEGDPAELAEPHTTDPCGEALPHPIEHYLAQLSSDKREALVLHHALGYSVAEIARLTSTPTDTIKSRLFYGLRQVRRLIRRDLGIGSAPADRSAKTGGTLA